MAAVELLETPECYAEPALRLVRSIDSRSFRQGVPLAERRRARANVHQRRRRLALALVVATALAILAVPGHVLGATGGTGLSNDLANSSDLASGMVYVVQPGDTINTIAEAMNPTDPRAARDLLVRELGSSAVVAGEHVLIP